MNGPIVQIVSLALFGNASRSNKVPSDYYPNNSVFEFCKSVQFYDIRNRLLKRNIKKLYALDPVEWLEKRQSLGTKGYRLKRIPENRKDASDRMLAGLVGGGGTWCLIEDMSNSSQRIWTSTWEVGDQKDPNRKIWITNYYGQEGLSFALANPKLDEIENQLYIDIENIFKFSSKHKIEYYTEEFKKSLEIIRSKGKQLYGYHKDLVPSQYEGSKIKYLLDACSCSWVFGAMGSWNDMSFEGKEQTRYTKLTDSLFSTVCRCIEDCVNESFNKNGV